MDELNIYFLIVVTFYIINICSQLALISTYTNLDLTPKLLLFFKFIYLFIFLFFYFFFFFFFFFFFNEVADALSLSEDDAFEADVWKFSSPALVLPIYSLWTTISCALCCVSIPCPNAVSYLVTVYCKPMKFLQVHSIMPRNRYDH